MRDDARAGKENIEAGDMIIPRVGLVQAISPEAVDGRAKSGNFFHTINEQDLGDTLSIAMLHHSKRYTLWMPRHAGGGIIARASDGLHWDADFSTEFAPYKDQPRKKVKYSAKKGDLVGRDHGLGRWGTLDPENEDSGPAATLSHVFVARALEHLDLGPFVIFLQRSGEPAARMLLSKISIATAPIYGQVFKMGSRVVTSDSGDYNQYTFAKDGFLTDEALYTEFKEQNAIYTALGVKTNEEAPDADGATGGDKAPPAADTKGDTY